MKAKEAIKEIEYLIGDGVVLEHIVVDLPQESIEALEIAIEALKKQSDENYIKIVRCKDCSVPHNKYTGCPKLNGLVTPPDFYCAFGMHEITEDIL